MATYTLRRKTVIPGNLNEVFSFFEDPRNLAEITPPWLNFRVEGFSDAVMKAGTSISYKISWLGVAMPWQSLIAEYEKYSHFADEMVRGPYKSWYHVHRFRSVQDGVEMSDTVEYSLPFGPVGALAHLLFVRRQLKGIFDYREKRIRALFGEA